MDSYLTLDGLRAVLVTVLAVGQAVMASWPDLRRWPATIATRSAAQQTPVVPVPWAFAVWGLIFLGCGAFAVWHALPQNLADPLFRTVGWLAAAVCLINIAWEYHVPTRDIDAISVLLIVTALIALLAILFALERAEPLSAARQWLVAFPLQLFAGWITAATFVNLSSTMKLYGIRATTPRCLLLLLGAVTLGVTIAFATGALVYTLAIAWALFGIVVANRGPQGNRAVALLSGFALPILPLAALAGG